MTSRKPGKYCIVLPFLPPSPSSVRRRGGGKEWETFGVCGAQKIFEESFWQLGFVCYCVGMTLKNARKQIEQLGFTFPKENKCMDGTYRWGQKPPERHSTGKNHFRPWFRDVFIAKAKGGWYVTSHIKGQMRQYRCRYWNDASILNIFGHGSTLQIAVDSFVTNFNSGTYNTSGN